MAGSGFEPQKLPEFCPEYCYKKGSQISQSRDW